MYDFDKMHDRRGTVSVKWDKVGERFGNPDAISMWIADADFECPKEVVDAIIERAKHPIYGYAFRPEAGIEAFIKWSRERHGFDIKPEWVRITTGVTHGMATVIRTFTEKGDNVLVMKPVYDPFFYVIEDNGRKILDCPMIFEDGQFRIDFAGFEECLKSGVKLFIFCSPQNPTGRVFTREELTRIADLCVKYNCMVMSDDLHSEFVTNGHKYIPLASINDEIKALTITGYSPSKTFNILGLTVAALVIPNDEIRARYDAEDVALHVKTNNLFGIVAFEAAYVHGGQYVDDFNTYVEQNRDFVLSYIKERIPRISAIKNEGTYLMMFDFADLGLEGRALVDFLAHKAGVAVNNGGAYGDALKTSVRVNIACPRKTLEEALARIETAVNNYI